MQNTRVTANKKQRLSAILKQYDHLCIAFSGGVDSTLLVAVARLVLGDRAVAMTAVSPTLPEKELLMAKTLAKDIGVRHFIFESNEMDLPDFTKNSPDRCYHCKKAIFTGMRSLAGRMGMTALAHGANVDDLRDHRPGFVAARELNVQAPLIAAQFTKEHIRSYARELGLPNWNRPAMACLATRLPYGVQVTPKALDTIAAAESILEDLEFNQCRVRYKDGGVRIEVPAHDIERLCAVAVRTQIVHRLKGLGIDYVSLDLEGYISGKLNRDLYRP